MIKYTNKKVIEVQDWDRLVKDIYGKQYSFQQQNGCQDRGVVGLTVSKEELDDNYPDEIPFKINGNEMGISFKTWLSTTEENINNNNPETYRGSNNLWWQRNFYPNLEVIANDLCRKGLIEEGEYSINIDW